MKRRIPFNELKDMGYGDHGWGSEQTLKGKFYKTLIYPDLLDRYEQHGEVKLKFELLDKKFVMFTTGGNCLKNGESPWSAENILNGESPECYQKVIGEHCPLYNRKEYTEKEKLMKLEDMKQQIKNLKASVKEWEKSSKEFQHKNSELQDQLNRQAQAHTYLTTLNNDYKSINQKVIEKHNNLKNLLKAFALKEESKKITVTQDMVKVSNSFDAILNYDDKTLSIELVPVTGGVLTFSEKPVM